jgi:hypothetical protein
MVRASGCQCQSGNSPGLDPSILRHSGIWRAADEAVLNIAHKNKNKIKINKTLFRLNTRISCYLSAAVMVLLSFLLFPSYSIYIFKKITRRLRDTRADSQLLIINNFETFDTWKSCFLVVARDGCPFFRHKYFSSAASKKRSELRFYSNFYGPQLSDGFFLVCVWRVSARENGQIVLNIL